MTSKSISVLGYVLVVIGMVLLLFFGYALSSSPVVITTQVAAVVLMIWARVTFGRRSFHFAANTTEGGLVTNGPYRYVRHPIYASILYFIVPGVMANLRLESVLLCAVVLSGTMIRVRMEEQFLRQTYPEYGEYMRKTKRFIPGVL